MVAFCAKVGSKIEDQEQVFLPEQVEVDPEMVILKPCPNFYKVNFDVGCFDSQIEKK